MSALARCRVDFVIHTSADIGSPRVSGSTNALNCAASPGSVSANRLRPPPGARTRDGGLRGSFGLTDPPRDRVRVNPGHRGDRLDRTPTDLRGLHTQQQTTLTLIKMRTQHRIPVREGLRQLRDIGPSTTVALTGQNLDYSFACPNPGGQPPDQASSSGRAGPRPATTSGQVAPDAMAQASLCLTAGLDAPPPIVRSTVATRRRCCPSVPTVEEHGGSWGRRTKRRVLPPPIGQKSRSLGVRRRTDKRAENDQRAIMAAHHHGRQPCTITHGWPYRPP